jgi:FkbM family methyltransferase
VPRDLTAPLPVEHAAQRALLRAVLARAGVGCVIDVGARTGDYGALLRALGFGGTIVSVEPVAESFAALERRAAADPGWHAHRLALGREAGRARIGVARESNFSSFLAPTRFSLEWFGGSAVAREEEVDVQRLDAVFDSLVTPAGPVPVLLKTDTQGFDLEVLEGARGCLDRVAALQVELSVRPVYEGAPDWLEAVGFVRSLGFRAVHLTPVGRDAELGLVELDGLFVRPHEWGGTQLSAA